MKNINKIDEILSDNKKLEKYIDSIEKNDLDVELNIKDKIKIYVKSKIEKEQKLKNIKKNKIFDYTKVAGFAILVFIMSEVYANLSKNINDEKILGFTMNIETKMDEAGKSMSNFLLEPIKINKEEK